MKEIYIHMYICILAVCRMYLGTHFKFRLFTFKGALCSSIYVNICDEHASEFCNEQSA